jgi:hypothetical protein
MNILKSNAAQRWAAVAVWGGAMALGASSALAGPTSALYISDGSTIRVRQGDAIINSWLTTSHDEFALAVNSTVRTFSQGFVSTLSHEYTLGGAPTGVTYENTVGCCFRDGTTDGTYNYATRSGDVYQFNSDWTNALAIPGLTGQGLSAAITYDYRKDMFWVASGELMIGVSRTGVIVPFYSFYMSESILNDLSALAFDPADNTLWISSYQLNGTVLQQYSTAPNTQGSLKRVPLSREVIDFQPTGMEFALRSDGPVTSVPEPGSLLLVLSSLLGLGVCRRKALNTASASA